LSDRLTIDIVGILHGSADGPLAIAALVFIVVLVTKRLLWPRRHRPIVLHASYDEDASRTLRAPEMTKKAISNESRGVNGSGLLPDH
jgi:hypothetical protein